MAGEYDIEVPSQPLPKVTKKTKELLWAAMEDPTENPPPAYICIYGDQGTGKSVSMMTFMLDILPEGKRLIYIDSGKGWTSFQNHPDIMQALKDKRWRRMKYENLEQLIALAGAIREGGPFSSIGAVILDEYSSMIKKDKTWIVKARAQQKEEKGEFKDPFQPAQPDYLASQIRSEDVLNSFMESDIHVGFLSHEKWDDKQMVTRPDFPPGAANDFQRLLHSVLRATVKLDKTTKQPIREIQLQPIGNRVSVKNRIGGLGNFISDISELTEAYRKWGIQTKAPDVTLTEAEVETIQEDNDLLRLLNDPTTPANN
jgi:hypothetical protein